MTGAVLGNLAEPRRNHVYFRQRAHGRLASANGIRALGLHSTDSTRTVSSGIPPRHLAVALDLTFADAVLGYSYVN
jgi:hypothetical protein